jgi:hypothetical protein
LKKVSSAISLGLISRISKRRAGRASNSPTAASKR